MIVQLTKEQNNNDQMPSSLLDRLQRILLLADKVADEIISGETEILDNLMLRMFEVMQMIAKFLCHYVKGGRFSRWSLFWMSQVLMIAERTGDAVIYSKEKEMFEKMDRELANVIEDFLRAVDVEALRIARTSGKYSYSQYSVGLFSIAFCRARASTQAAYTYQDWLSPGSLLYGRHPQVSPQRNRRLGGQ